MGLPSYAQPIIGEWSVDGISVPLDICKSFLPYNVFPSWFVPKTDSLSFLGAYKWLYWSPLPSLYSWAIYPSSCVKDWRYLSNKLILQLWILALNSTPAPGKKTVTVVDPWTYPLPPSITLIDFIWLFNFSF